MKMRIPLMIGAACLMHVMMTTSAIAQSDAGDYETASIAVGYSDLDLNTQEGSSAMLHRLRSAAYRVCEGSGDRTLRQRRQVRACVDSAMNNAVTTANLTTQYAAGGAEVQPVRAVTFDSNGARARVSYGDLNLNSASGRVALERRIESASRAVCGQGLMRILSRAQRNCVNEVREDTAQQVAAVTSQRQLAAVQAPPSEAQVAPAAIQTTTATAAPVAQPAALVVPAGASASYGVCDARTHAAAFSGAALGTQARREIGYAIDAASVCQLESAVIEANGSALSTHRAQALRAALISRGVPAERIQVVRSADAGATGGEVRMSFSGVAHSVPETRHADAGA
jgi:UrcA family protein